MRVKYEPQVSSVKVEATHSLVFLIHTRCCVCVVHVCVSVFACIQTVCVSICSMYMYIVYTRMKHSKGTHV